ncbi:MAG: hypothetical protein JST20_10575 [Bacteroidetes bacterium]|nr:hypothetical protein [Bacteroidota bacterium]
MTHTATILHFRILVRRIIRFGWTLFEMGIFIGSLLVVHNSTNAQTPYACEPISPCSTVAWTTGTYTTADVGGAAYSCSAIISYKYRKCSNGFVEVTITSIIFTGTDCSGLSSAEIFDRSLYLLFLSKIPAFIDTQTDPQDWKFWKVARPGCIKKGTPMVGGSTALLACSSDCCTTLVTVEKNTEECTKYIYSWEYPNTFQPLCPQIGSDGCHENCSVNIEHSFDTSRYPH